MAGGRGRRLGGVEKPLVEIDGRPMISWVINAVEEAGLTAWVAASPRTPRTRMWALANGKNVIDTSGQGFVPDMIEAVEGIGASGGVLIVMSDLPLLTPDIITNILDEYNRAGKPALSVHVPLSLCTRMGLRPDTVFHRKGEAIVPVGVNMVDAALVREEQDEHYLVIHEPRLAVNVNRPEDISLCERMMWEYKLK